MPSEIRTSEDNEKVAAHHLRHARSNGSLFLVRIKNKVLHPDRLHSLLSPLWSCSSATLTRGTIVGMSATSLFCTGVQTIHRVGLAIMTSCSSELLKMDSLGQVLPYLQHLPPSKVRNATSPPAEPSQFWWITLAGFKLTFALTTPHPPYTATTSPI